MFHVKHIYIINLNNLLKKFFKKFLKKLLTKIIKSVIMDIMKEGGRKMKKLKKQKRKMRNETKLIILLNIIVIGILIYKFKINGISWISTIGYFK